MLLKFKLLLVKSQINTNTNQNGLQFPTKCIERILNYSFLVSIILYYKSAKTVFLNLVTFICVDLGLLALAQTSLALPLFTFIEIMHRLQFMFLIVLSVCQYLRLHQPVCQCPMSISYSLLSSCLSVCLYFFLSAKISDTLFICPSNCPSVSPSICTSFRMSVYMSVQLSSRKYFR